MADRLRNVLFPVALPTQSLLREAARNIIMDLQKQTGETDHEMAEKLGVSASTIANARNRKNDIGSLTIAKIAAKYGEAAVTPYRALYGAGSHGVAANDPAPLREVSESLAAMIASGSLKERLDALATLKKGAEALTAYVMCLEAKRISL